MLESNALHLGSLLTAAAGRLQQDLIRLTGSNHIEVSSHERAGFEAPALKPPPDLVPGLSELPHLIYGSNPSADAILGAWDTLATCLLTGSRFKEAIDTVTATFPGMACKGFNLMDVSVRFLYAAGWNSRETGAHLLVSHHQIVLVVKGRSIGLVDNNVLLGTVRRRLRKFSTPDIATALQCPVGNPKTALAKTSGLYRKLTVALPSQSEVIHAVFASAVQAGREYERILTTPFDITLIKIIDPSTSAWAEARKVIREAEVNPAPELFRLLRGRVLHATFQQTFGNPYRPGGDYNHKTRAKHLSAIAHLELAESPDSTGASALQLLAFQQAISNINV